MSYTATHAMRLKDGKSLASKVKAVTDGHETRITALEGMITVKDESEWSSSNPVLKLGEVAVSTGYAVSIHTAKFNKGVANKTKQSNTRSNVKIGDGTSKWSALKYLDEYTLIDIHQVATLAAEGIYAVEQRCTALETAKTSLEARCTALETALKTVSEALIGITNGVITNISKEE